MSAPLTEDHCFNQPGLRVAELCPRAAEQAYEPLGLAALAARMGVSRSTAWRIIDRLRGAQHRPDALRVVRISVPIGKGARREAWHVLWPRPTDDMIAA